VKVVRAALLGCVLLPAGKPFSAVRVQTCSGIEVRKPSRDSKSEKRLPHFMMLTIVSMIVSSPALLPPAAMAESNSDEQAAENTYKAYVQAWKTKDIAALQNLISQHSSN
jgi:hypothetical protein